MKRDRVILLVAAAVCLAAAFLCAEYAGAESGVQAVILPFAALGAALRSLSLSSGAGNAAALALYALISLSPLAFCRRGRLNWPLAILSGYLFFALYLFVNPALAYRFVPPVFAGQAGALPVVQLALAGLFYSMALAFIALRLLRMERLYLAALGVLRWVSLLLVAVICFFAPLIFLMATDKLTAAPRLLADIAPPASLLYVVFAAERLLASAMADPFAAENEALALAVARRCRLSIYVSVGSMVLVNLAQLLLARFSENASIQVSIDFPLLPLALAYGMLLLSRYFASGHALKRDNDLMI